MTRWRPALLLASIAIALVGLVAGIYFNQSLIAIVSVLVAVFTALSPTVVPSLSDEIQANNSRYARHREYFSNVILPIAGSMELVEPHSIRLLDQDRLGWKIGDGSGNTQYLPGLGEHRIPAYADVFLPHLNAKNSHRAWKRMLDTWTESIAAVSSYTTARRKFDVELFRSMDAQIREKVGNEYQPNWNDYRGIDRSESRLYHAPQIRDCVEYWFQGMYGRPGWQWFGPDIAPAGALGAEPWAITVGGSSMVLLWGGAIPNNLPALKAGVTAVIDFLRGNERLKGLYEEAARAEQSARGAPVPLAAVAFDAANLLKHGPDIPGDCVHCRAWHPRF